MCINYHGCNTYMVNCRPHQRRPLLQAHTAENLPHPKRFYAVASYLVDPKRGITLNQNFATLLENNLIEASEKSDNLTASVSMQGTMKGLALNAAILCQAASPAGDQGQERGGRLVTLQAHVEQRPRGRGGPRGLEGGQWRDLPTQRLHQDLLL